MLRRSVVLVVSLSVLGCSEECVDQFDCLKISSKSTLTCDDGRCVVKSTLPTFPSFGPMDAGRGGGAGGGTSGDGGVQPRRVIPGDYTARLSGGQIVPPVTTMASGQATVRLSQDDAGTSLSWSMTFTNLVPTAAVLMVGAPAGRSVFNFVVLNDGGITSPFAGSVPLSRAQAEAVSAFGTSLLLTSAAQRAGEIRGQIVPRGSIIGFTQFVRRSTGQYGGGGQLVLETDGGFIPVAGSFEFDWTESGPVASASVSQGGTGDPIVPLPLNATGTGSAGTFDPLSLLLMVRDAGVYVTGNSADGGEVFRGDLSLSLR